MIFLFLFIFVLLIILVFDQYIGSKLAGIIKIIIKLLAILCFISFGTTLYFGNHYLYKSEINVYDLEKLDGYHYMVKDNGYIHYQISGEKESIDIKSGIVVYIDSDNYTVIIEKTVKEYSLPLRLFTYLKNEEIPTYYRFFVPENRVDIE